MSEPTSRAACPVVVPPVVPGMMMMDRYCWHMRPVTFPNGAAGFVPVFGAVPSPPPAVALRSPPPLVWMPPVPVPVPVPVPPVPAPPMPVTALPAVAAHVPAAGQGAHTCLLCGKSFFDQSNLNRHSRTHTTARPFRCNVCLRTFRDGSNLNRHRLTHEPKFPLSPCDFCGRDCDSLKTREEHMLEAHLSHVVNCKDCGVAFASAKFLQDHQRRMHVKKQPLAHCLVCNKGFNDLSNLRRHGRTHTGERPFECEVCHRTFRDPSHLNTHRRIHQRIGVATV